MSLRVALLIAISISVIVSCSVLSITPFAAASAQAGFTNDQGGLYYTGIGGNASTLYQDAIDPNQDVGIRLCGHGARYVGGYYALNLNGTFLQALVTYATSSQALALTDNPTGAGCYEVTPGYVTISPSSLSTPSPAVYKAAFPGQLWVGYSVSSNPGNLTTFVVGGNDTLLRGNYSYDSSYDASTRKITIQEPTVTFTTPVYNFSRTTSDPLFGINSQRPLLVGVCNDADGTDCSDGSLLTSSTFPVTLDSGLTAGQANDQQLFTKFVVINGIGRQMCIGPNLRLVITNVTPQPAYFGQDITISTRITNVRDAPTEAQGGNVGVSSPYFVNVVIANATNASQAIFSQVQSGDPLAPGQWSDINFTYTARVGSGTYAIRAGADMGDLIAECNESDNNDALNITLASVGTPAIQIDGATTTTFPQPNIPYAVNVTLTTSDNNSVFNATVRLVQVNGLNVNTGTQIFNVTVNASSKFRSGVTSRSVAQFTTNNKGSGVITYVPTYNGLYAPQYAYLQLPTYIGNSQVYLEADYPDGTPIQFLVNNSITTQYPLTIANLSTSVNVVQKSVLFNDTISQTFDDIYRAFTDYVQSITG